MITFRPLFSKRVFANAMVLVVGTVLAPGRRTVAAALRAVGLARERTYQQVSPRLEPRGVVPTRGGSAVTCSPKTGHAA